MRNRRTLCGIVAFCFLLPFPIAAATVVEWNFNSPAEDTDTNSGTLSSSRGNGAVTLVGSTSSFGEVGSGQTSDSAPADNSRLRLRGLPRIDAANKSVGVEFTIVTLGHENLILS